MASRKANSGNAAAERFKSLYAHGFVRVAACAPVVVPAEPAANADAILAFWREADAEKAAVLLTPELSLSGYAIDDLLLQETLARRRRRRVGAAQGREREAVSGADRRRAAARAKARSSIARS